MSRAPAVALLAFVGACSLYANSGDDDDDSTIDAAMIDAPIDTVIIEPFDRYPDAPANSGFVLPTATTKANMNSGGVWTEVGDADWACLGTPSSDQPSTGTIALSGKVRDFQTGNGVGDATVTAWSTSPSATVGSTTSRNIAATRGDYSMTLGMLPTSTRRYSFTLAATGYLSTRSLGHYYAPGAAATDDLVALSQSTATALPAFIGVDRDPSKAFFVGTLRDCQGRAVSNAVAAVSITPSTYQNAGGETFYFSAGSTSLPVRHSVSPVINKDGLFTILEVPPGTGFIQVWGFPTIGDLNAQTLRLLSETPVTAQANEVAILTATARRTP